MRKKKVSFVQVYQSDVGQEREAISAARRKIILYFQKCAQLLRSGSITKQMFDTIAFKHGLNVLQRIVIPLEEAKFGDEVDFYEAYPEIQIFQEPQYAKHGDGLFSFERKNSKS